MSQQASWRRVRRAFATFTLLGALCGDVSPAAAQDSDKAAVENLVILWTTKQLDQRCHVLTPEQRAGLDTQIAVLAKVVNITEAKLAEMLEGNDIADTACDDEIAKLMFDFARRTPAKPKEPAPAKSEAEQAKEDWEFVQNSWAEHFRTLPAGRLAAYDGCWSGQIDKVPIQLCLSDKGDKAKVTVGAAGGVQCAFANGGARQREETLLFYAPSVGGKCSDGSAIQHIEGGCQPIAENELECIVTVFSRGNLIYETKDGTALTGGDIALKRAVR